MKKVELLAPAGNMENLKYAVMAGCDAVYLGLKNLVREHFHLILVIVSLLRQLIIAIYMVLKYTLL